MVIAVEYCWHLLIIKVPRSSFVNLNADSIAAFVYINWFLCMDWLSSCSFLSFCLRLTPQFEDKANKSRNLHRNGQIYSHSDDKVVQRMLFVLEERFKQSSHKNTVSSFLYACNLDVDKEVYVSSRSCRWTCSLIT